MDGSGSVDDYEFICGLALFMKTKVEQRFEAVFQLFDRNASQTCDKDEFRDMVEAVLSLNRTAPIEADKLSAKIKELKGTFFMDSDYVTMDLFIQMAMYDKDMRDAFLDIGIFTKAEIDELGEDPDVTAEQDKYDEYILAEETGDQSMPSGPVVIKGLDQLGFDTKTEPGGLFQTEKVDEGDQFMAIKPWMGVVRNGVPTWYKPSKGENDAPNASLEMKYIHGFRCHDTRNNIFYTPEGKLVYHTAKVGIQLDTRENKQKFVVKNVDDIISMDCWKNLCATGDITNKPALVLWDNVTMEAKAVLIGVIRKGISMISFSRDGSKLACASMDQDFSIFIFDVQMMLNQKRESMSWFTLESVIAVFKGPRDKLFDLKFDQTGSTLIGATNNEIYLINGGKLSKASGWGPKTSNKQCTMCVGFSGNETVVGCVDGKILRMRSGTISYALDAHKACVNTIFSRPNGNGFISGGSDGKVIVWDSAFTKSNVFDLSTFKDIPIMNPRVRAVSESLDGKKIVIGTRSSNIIEVDVAGGSRKCVNFGHFDKELWGLAIIPQSDEFITCGEDFMLAKWDLKGKKLIRTKRLPFMAKVCDVSSDSQMVAVGCINGKVLIMNTTDFNQIKEFSSGTKEISEVKFSPDNKMIAVGSHDSRIRVYLTNGFKLYAECKKNLSTVTHIDWSTSSQFIQSNSTSYEILYFTADGKQVTSGASSYKDELWASWNCVIGWPVQGIWPKFADGTDVNSVTRNKDRSILATADDFGLVKLFKYPCVVEKAMNNEFVGHSSHVTNVRFSDKDDFVISTGGNDKCIIQWKFIHGNASGHDEVEIEGDFDDDGFVESDLSTVPQEAHLRPRDIKPSKNEQPAMYGDFAIEENDEGDQALAVKPFLGEIEPSKPRDYKPNPQGHLAPTVDLKLHHAFGFRCFDAKDSAKFGEGSNTCVFITAALGVCMDITAMDQSFFNMHDEDLVSMDVTPDRRFCATGSMPAKGRSKKLDIYVWDTQTMEKKAFLTGFLTGAVKHLKFSPNGNYLLGVGQDENNSLAIYDWRNQTMICNSKVERSPVFDCDWKDDNSLVTVGKDFIKFFRISNGSCSGTKGAWGNSQRVALASCKFAKNVCFSGTWNGQIIPWNGTSCGKAIKAHDSAVFCLHYNKEKDQLLSGGKDGIIYSWKVNGDTLQKISTVYDCSKDLDTSTGGIRSIDTHPDGSILVGTRSAQLVKISPEGTKEEPFMSAHYDGELWGLACHPTKPLIVSAGDDKSLRLFDCANKLAGHMYFYDSNLRAVDWSSDGELIVAASMTGDIVLFSNELDEICKLKSGFTKKGTDQWIEEIKFSPNCSMVAFGSHGGYSPIEIMKITDKKLSRYASISAGFTSAVLHLDWSTDSSCIVGNSQAAELKFVSVASQKPIRSSDTKDYKWHTWTCKFGFPVQGIWAGVDYSDVNTVCRSENQKILAIGEDSQKIKLFKYPCVKEKSQFKSYTAHASHVTRVRFMLKDNLLVSVGGNDKTICVWRTDFGDPEVRSQLEKKGSNYQNADIDESEVLNFSNKIKKETVDAGDQSMPGQPGALATVRDNDSPFNFEIGAQEQGDEFMAVRPWEGAVKPPTTYTKPRDQDKAPKITLTLDHCHGYRSKDKRNNIFYVNNDDVCYYAAAVGIVHNVRANTQRFFIRHRDDILSMSVHPNKSVVATGELHPKPMICIWSSESCTQICTVTSGIAKGVDNLCYSSSGKYLLAGCMDDDHKIFIYDSENNYSLVTTEKGGREFILGVTWINDLSFVTVGIKHYKYWNLSGSTLKGNKGAFKTKDDMLTCVAKTANNDILCGSAQGNLQIWQGASSIDVKEGAHKKFLDAIAVGNKNIFTGGKDAKVKIWDFQYNHISTIDIYSVAPDTLDGHVRAIALDEKNAKMTVGLFSSEIYEFNIPSPAQPNPSNVINIVKGHFAKNKKWTNEVWGLSLGVDEDTYLTCSDDGVLRKWSMSKRKCIDSLDLNLDAKGVQAAPDPKTGDLQDSSKNRSIDVHPKGLAVIGTMDGTIKVVNIKVSPMKFMSSFKHRTRWIQELKFSPDGTKLAIGAHDAWLNFYEIPSFKMIGKAKKHSSAITHLDWSTDSRFIHSTDQACELLFFDTSGKQITSGATMFKDEQWATWSVVFGWPVKGIWQAHMDASDINMVDRSNKDYESGYKLLACGNDRSQITIYRYPCLTKGAEFVLGSGHASHVTNVKFSPQDKYLLSTGGEDQTVMQWRISTS